MMDKNVAVCMTTAGDLITRVIDSDAVFFQDEVSLAKAMARLRSGPEPKDSRIPGYDRGAAASVLDGKQGILSAEDVHKLLKAAGFRPVPQTIIKDRARGILVQPVVTGTEMILGISREEGFGRLAMFELGGIFTESKKGYPLRQPPTASGVSAFWQRIFRKSGKWISIR